MQQGGRGIVRLALGTPAAAPACAAIQEACAQPLALLRQLSVAAEQCSGPADPQQQAPLQQRTSGGTRQRRRLSHCAASTSARCFSTGSAARGSSASPERGYASQPAFDYDVQRGEAAPAEHVAAATDYLGQARQAAAKLKAQAAARIDAQRAEQLLVRDDRLAHNQRRRNAREGAGADDEDGNMLLRRRPLVCGEDAGPQLPVWAQPASGATPQSAAALQLYRQEVLHGQDVSRSWGRQQGNVMLRRACVCLASAAAHAVAVAVPTAPPLLPTRAARGGAGVQRQLCTCALPALGHVCCAPGLQPTV